MLVSCIAERSCFLSAGYHKSMGPTSSKTNGVDHDELLDTPEAPGVRDARRAGRRSLVYLLISACVLFLIVPAGEFALISVAQNLDTEENQEAAKEEAADAKNRSGFFCVRWPNCSNQNCFPGCGAFLFGVSGTLVATFLAIGTLPLSILGCSNALRARSRGRASGSASVLYVLNLLCGLVAGLASFGLLAFFIFIADSVSSAAGS